MLFGRWAKKASEIFRIVEEYDASVFEVYFDSKFKPHAELKRHFKTVEEALRYVEEARAFFLFSSPRNR
jgi:hypothetical protein